jgi:hypothetical protein
MVEGIVKKIMITGIDKYADKYKIKDAEIQIKVIDSDSGVLYKICEKYLTEKEEVSFLQIMNKKIDMFGYEGLASPFLKRSLIECAEENKLNVSQVCCFIFKYFDTNKKSKIGLAFYEIINHKPQNKLSVVSLSVHLQKLGL